MPVLKDMTKLYVGTSPIEKVYAGTSLVWNTDSDFEVVQYIDKRGVISAGFDAWCISWSYNFDPFTCEEAGNLFSVRFELIPFGSGNWSQWYKFNESAFLDNQTWLYKADDRLVWCNVQTNSLDVDIGQKWQIRLVQGGKTVTQEIIKTDIRGTGPNAPNEWFQTQCV